MKGAQVWPIPFQPMLAFAYHEHQLGQIFPKDGLLLHKWDRKKDLAIEIFLLLLWTENVISFWQP